MINPSFFAPAGDSQARMELPAAVRNAQIVVGAVSVGAMSFLIVALVARREGFAPRPAARNQPTLSYMALGVSAGSLIALVVVPALMVTAGRKQIVRQLADAEPAARLDMAQLHLAGLFLRKTIIAAALAEGAAFLCLVALMIEGETTALIAAGLMIGLVMWQFPNLASAERWVDEQTERLARDFQG